MKNPLVSLVRWYVLRQRRSTVPTALLPLGQVKSVTVFVDAVAMGEDPAPVCRTVQHYFESVSIPVVILCPQKADINCWGYLKPKARGGRRDERKEDLFISLAARPDRFAAEYDALAAQGAKAIVLDLRGNGGGAVGEAVAVADHLIHKDGVISIFKRQCEVIETVRSTADAFADLPVVCLVDHETASASELLTAALKDRQAATIVGETTYGKGVAQFVGSGGQGNYFKLSVYYFLSPKGSDIDGVGIVPDVAVYAQGERTAEEIAQIRASVAPINEAKKYYAGDSGLNVYGVQQRLAKMGYDVEASGVMDAKTVAALKLVQTEAGVCPYGALDFCTLGIVKDKFDAWCDPGTEDAALAKALELLR